MVQGIVSLRTHRGVKIPKFIGEVIDSLDGAALENGVLDVSFDDVRDLKSILE